MFNHPLFLFLSISLPVPFREAPAGTGRSRPPQHQGRSTLAAPRVLLRSNSDNNLNVNKLPLERSRSPSPSPVASPLRSLLPRHPQQMQNSPNGTVKTMARGGRSARSRSPSLGRLGEGDTRRQTPQRHSRSVAIPKGSNRGSFLGQLSICPCLTVRPLSCGSLMSRLECVPFCEDKVVFNYCHQRPYLWQICVVFKSECK